MRLCNLSEYYIIWKSNATTLLFYLQVAFLLLIIKKDLTNISDWVRLPSHLVSRLTFLVQRRRKNFIHWWMSTTSMALYTVLEMEQLIPMDFAKLLLDLPREQVARLVYRCVQFCILSDVSLKKSLHVSHPSLFSPTEPKKVAKQSFHVCFKGDKCIHKHTPYLCPWSCVPYHT